jgi:hypothetical protein
LNSLKKWNIYQRERFPILPYSFLISTLIFAVSALNGNFDFVSMVKAFVVALLMFFLLRVADEFKDYEDDCKYRPYRAVPRGLVSLKSLGILGTIALLIQLVILYSGAGDTALYAFFLVLGYWGLMSVEFFVPKWLKAHATIYLLSHMVLMPMISWLLLAMMGAESWMNFLPFLLLSFLNGVVLEVGRKIRQRDEEEDGVDTYSALWGAEKALVVWKIVIALGFVCALILLPGVMQIIALAILALLLFFIQKTARNFLADKTLKGKKIDTLSAVWLLATYILIGVGGVV